MKQTFMPCIPQVMKAEYDVSSQAWKTFEMRMEDMADTMFEDFSSSENWVLEEGLKETIEVDCF